MSSIRLVLVAFLFTAGYASSTDLLNQALNESYGLNMYAIYNEALIHLDMENVTTVSSKIDFAEDVFVYSSSHNCSTILQVEGIPWDSKNGTENLAMRINDSGSYVEVNETVSDTSGGNLTVSMWIKTSDSNSFECTVLTVGTNETKLKLKRKPDKPDNPPRYSLTVSDDESEVANFSFKTEWEWNMLSFTMNSEGHITAYENGAYTKGTNTSHTFQDSSTVWKIRLNGDNFSSNSLENHGCEEVELDEVAVWSRILNMSEFIALRVQPFDTNCTVNVSVLVNRIEDGTPEEASAAVKELVIVLGNSDEDRELKSFFEEVEKGLAAMEDKSLLSSEELDEETRKENREAFVQLTAALLDAATKEEVIATAVKENNVIKRMDEVMSSVYFSENFPAQNETISAPYLTTKYYILDQQPDESGLTLEDNYFKFTIPKSVVKEEGTAVEVILTLYEESLNEFIASDPEVSDIVGRMVSLQLNGVLSNFQEPIILIFPDAGKNNADKLGNSTPVCSYLDLKLSKWKNDGVSTIYEQGANDVICQLSHLTNFAVLLSPTDLDHNETLSALTYVLLAISIVCLIITLVVLMCLREIANTQRVQILKHFIFALLMSQLLFVFTTDLVKHKTFCMIFAAILHYFWLATFTWMLVQGIQLYTKVRRLVGGNIKQIFYVLFAWGFPLPMATIPLAIFSKSYYENEICWIPAKLILFFAVPVIVIFCVNLGVTVLVMKTFLTVKVNKDKSDAEKLKSSMRAVVVMVPVLGLTWAFGLLLLVDQNDLFQYLFVILNTLQGVFIFLFHFVMNEDVKSAILRRRNKVAANAENTIFTKLPRNKSEHSGGTGTETSKAPLHSDSTTNM